MAKKRKATAQSQQPLTGLGIDPKESRKRIRTYDDVANSEDDEFHNNQDEIRLGEDAAVKRRRKLAENEQFLEPSDEEVLGYSDEEESGADVDSGVAARDAVVSGSEDAEGGAEGDDGASEGDDGESEEEYRWGTSKAELYGADAIETEEQAREEEAEAIRLQKKQLQQMSAADYGFDEDEWHDKPSAKSSRETEGATVTEILPQLHIDPAMSSADRLKLLRSRYPEFEPLSKELLHLQDVHESLRQAAPSSAIARTRLRAASAYLGALIMYFSLITCPAASGVDGSVALPAHKLHDHPVMDSLVKCRELWSRVSLLQDSSLAADAVDEANADAASVGKESLATPAPVARLLPQTQKKKSRAERHADATREAAEQRKAERLRRIEAELADLDIAVRPTKRKCAKDASKHPTTDLDSDVGEEAELTAREAADQAQRKKSLRFYTSQIAQHANKRGTAGRNAGGDDDIPHRERLKDRQARLNAEAQKRGQRGSREGADVGLGAESDEDDGAHARQIRADAEEDDYYDMVVARAARKKDDRAALAEAHQQAALQGGRVVQEESVGADGKRKITYAIAKNKGLTPHRKKDVRNPRVKKRKKFDEKKKKLASIKPVYKGGEGRGGYGGELTGIKKGLVKSTKLS